MAYIGVSPNAGTVATQIITSANGSATSFTLDQTVPDGQSIIVLVGNVVQQPTHQGIAGAYTASGNTITFTGAPANGDNIIIRYLGRSVDVATNYKRIIRYRYVATNGQQTFSGEDSNGLTLSYTVEDIDVFLNGVRLDQTDFTATNGTSVVLGSGATTSDELVVLAYNTVQLADTVPASTGGTFTGATTHNGGIATTTLTASGNITGTLATASQPNITTVGALNSGSITSGFGSINVGSSDIATTGSGNFGQIGATTVANISMNSQGSYLGNYRAIGWNGTSNGNTHIYSQYNTVDHLVLHGGTGKGIIFETDGSSADRMTLTSGGTLKTGNLTATTTSIANSAGTGSINTQGGDFVTGRAIFTGANNGGNASYLYGMNSEATRWVLYDFVNNVYKLIVANGGNVGITNGAIRTSPNNTFHNGSGSSGGGITTGDFCEFDQNKNEFILMLKNNNASVNQSHGLYITHSTNHYDTTSLYIQCTFSSFNRFLVYSNGSVYNTTGTYGTISDERLKSNIADAKSQWDDIKNIKVRNFKKYDSGDTVQIGVVAQEVEKVSPNLIDKVEPSIADVEHDSVFGRLYTSDDPETKPTLYTDSDDIPKDKKVGDEKEPPLKKVGDVKQNEPVKAIKYSVLYMKAIKALQEAMERIETLEAKVTALEKT